MFNQKDLHDISVATSFNLVEMKEDIVVRKRGVFDPLAIIRKDRGLLPDLGCHQLHFVHFSFHERRLRTSRGLPAGFLFLGDPRSIFRGLGGPRGLSFCGGGSGRHRSIIIQGVPWVQFIANVRLHVDVGFVIISERDT